MPVQDIRPVRISNRQLVLVCAKCTRKLDGGFGPRQEDSLKAALREHLKKAGRWKGVRVVETRCLGLCPKRAVTMIVATRPGEALVVPVGTKMERLDDYIGPGSEP